MPEIVVETRLDSLLAEITLAFRDAGVPNAGHEARLLIERFTGANQAELISGADRAVVSADRDAALAAMRRRIAGEPLHRIFGRRAFFGIELELSPATLEPRPDTEILVDRIIPHARRIAADTGTCDLLDLGTGTGAIALAVLAEVEGVNATGVDIDEGAVAVASANARLNGLAERFRAARSDWFSAVDGKFHIIVSNPPYISAREYEALPPEVREYDPKAALLGGCDGFEAYRRIARDAGAHLHEAGVVGVEIGFRQREAVSAIFAEHCFRVSEAAHDLAGHDRVLIFCR